MAVGISSLRHMALDELKNHLYERHFSHKDLVQTYLCRIAEVNSTFNAVIQTNPSVLEDAHHLDTSDYKSPDLSSLHGIPILLKDNLPTLDDTETTCGSFALVGSRPQEEAAVVKALRRAGCLILGKGNMAEWSGFRSTSGCSGWSARGGQCTGVFYPGMKASGSSSGCAVAVSLGLCFAAIGTETCWSIVSPAEKSAVVGFKPTRGWISTKGIIAASERLDSIGILTRNVKDAGIITAEIVRHDPVKTFEQIPANLRSFDPHAIEESNSPLWIGIPYTLSGFSTIGLPRVIALLHVIMALSKADAQFVPDMIVPGATIYDEALSSTEKNIILDTEMKVALNSYFSELAMNPNGIQSIDDLIIFTKQHKKEEYPKHDVAVLERAQKTDPGDSLYLDMRAGDECFTGPGGIEAAMVRHNCDVVLVPFLSGTMQTLAAKAGIPTISIPIGCYPVDSKIQKDEGSGLISTAPGVPFSVFMYSRTGEDMKLLRAASIIEKALRVRDNLRPYLAPTIELQDEDKLSTSFDYDCRT